MTTVQIRMAATEERYILQNIWPAYMHEYSQYQHHLPNNHGLLDEPDVTSYREDNFMTGWTNNRDKVLVFLIYSDSMLAGFMLIAFAPLVETSAEKLMHDFFLFRAYRGQGIGQAAARRVFDKFPGTWQLRVLPKNKTALFFWRKTLSGYSNRSFSEVEELHHDQPMVSFLFESDAAS